MRILSWSAVREATKNVFKKSRKRSDVDGNGSDGVTLLSYRESHNSSPSPPRTPSPSHQSSLQSSPDFTQTTNKRNPIYRHSSVGSASLALGARMAMDTSSMRDPEGYGFSASPSPTDHHHHQQQQHSADLNGTEYGFIDSALHHSMDASPSPFPPAIHIEDTTTTTTPITSSPHAQGSTHTASRAERLEKLSRKRSMRKQEEENELFMALAIIDNLEV